MPLAANSSSCPLTRPTSTRLNRPSPSSSTSCARRRPAPWRPSSPPPSRPIRASPPAMPTDSFGAPGITYENRSSDFANLLADRHLVQGGDQASDIALGGVVGDTRHRHPLALAHLPAGEHDVLHIGCNIGVLLECLVKVTEPEEEDGIGKAVLDLVVLTAEGHDSGGPRVGVFGFDLGHASLFQSRREESPIGLAA